MGADIIPFTDDWLPQAGALLAGRHRRDRQALPWLPARFADAEVAGNAVALAWRHAYPSGAAAVVDGRLVGYLLGDAVFDTLRGRHAWVRLPGYALAADASPELLAALYAAVGAAWLRQGSFDHYVMAPAGAGDELATWFSLSFGQEQAHAIRPLDEALPDRIEVPGVSFHLASHADRHAFVDMAFVLRGHLTEGPVWGVGLPEYRQAVIDGFTDMMDEPGVFIWLASRAGQVIGYQAYFPTSTSDDGLLIPENCVLLEVAATRPEARGLGVGRGLTARGLAHARAEGYTTCVCDWRTTNREAHRFWPRMGFRLAYYRLTRKVDSRIAWAVDRPQVWTGDKV